MLKSTCACWRLTPTGTSAAEGRRRIRDDVKRRLLVEHRLARFGHDLARDGFGARDERERAFNRKQADKPQCDHTPEKRHDPLRRFFEDNRSTSTARMSQLALMLRFTSFKKTSSMMILLSVKVDHFLHLVKLFVAHVARLCKRGDERGQRAVEALVEQLIDLGGLRLVL